MFSSPLLKHNATDSFESELNCEKRPLGHVEYKLLLY